MPHAVWAFAALLCLAAAFFFVSLGMTAEENGFTNQVRFWKVLWIACFFGVGYCVAQF